MGVAGGCGLCYSGCGLHTSWYFKACVFRTSWEHVCMQLYTIVALSIAAHIVASELAEKQKTKQPCCGEDVWFFATRSVFALVRLWSELPFSSGTYYVHTYVHSPPPYYFSRPFPCIPIQPLKINAQCWKYAYIIQSALAVYAAGELHWVHRHSNQ